MGRADAVSCSQMNLVGLVPIEGDFFQGVSHTAVHMLQARVRMDRLSASTHCHMQLCVCAQTYVHMYVHTCTIHVYVCTYIHTFPLLFAFPLPFAFPLQTGRAV